MNIPSKLKDYVKTVWKALRTGGTAWTPERLNNIEDGVEGTTGKINEIIDYLTEFKPQNVMTSQQYEALPDSRKDSQEVFYLSDVGKIICQRISYGGGGEDINLITYEQFKTMEAAGTFIEGGNYRVIDYPDETLLDSESVKYNNTNVKEELNTINGKISNGNSVVKYIRTQVTINANSEYVIDISSYVPDNYTVVDADIRLGTGTLPYYENGLAKTYISKISNNNITIVNNTSSWGTITAYINLTLSNAYN